MTIPPVVPGSSIAYCFGYQCAKREIARSTAEQLRTCNGGLEHWLPSVEDYDAFGEHLGRPIEDEITSDECGLFQAGYTDCCRETAAIWRLGGAIMISVGAATHGSRHY